jgi:hypothetical protein
MDPLAAQNIDTDLKTQSTAQNLTDKNPEKLLTDK